MKHPMTTGLFFSGLLLWAVSTGAHAQPAAPVPGADPLVGIDDNQIEHGSKELNGWFAKPEGACCLKVEVVDDKGISLLAASAYIDAANRKFHINLIEPLWNGAYRIQFTVSPGDIRYSAPVTVDGPKPLPAVKVLEVKALYGRSTVVIRTEPIKQIEGKIRGSLNLPDAGIAEFTWKGDALKDGKVEVPLGFRMVRAIAEITKDNGWKGILTLKSVPPWPLGKGDAGPRDVTEPFEVRSARISVPGIIVEGTKVIEGSAEDSVTKVLVSVYGGAFSGKEPEAAIKGDGRVRQLEGSYRLSALQNLVKTAKDNRTDGYRSRLTSARNQVANLMGEKLQEKSEVVDPKKHTFSATLSNPLPAGARVIVREVLDAETNEESQTVPFGPPDISVQSVGLDWGRARAVFTVGSALSQGSNTFGQADPYVAFNFDSSLLTYFLGRPDVIKRGKAGGPGEPEPIDSLFRNRRFGIAWHYFGDVRLTQTGTVGQLGTAPATLQPVQSAVMQAGTYLPMRVEGMDWNYGGIQYSAFVAPLMKGGFTALKDGVEIGKIVTTVTTLPDAKNPSATVPPPVTTPTSEKRQTPAPFYGYGFRIGIMKFDLMGTERRNRQLSADPVVYVDWTIGQNHAYLTPGEANVPVSITADGKTTRTVTYGSTLDRRQAIEARVKLPYIPIVIGADVNYANHAPGKSAAPSDYRFIVGFRVDAAKTLGALFGPAKTQPTAKENQ